MDQIPDGGSTTNIADLQLQELWDATFLPLWKFLVTSIRRQYPSLNNEDAEDLAGEVIHRLVKYFRVEQCSSLPRDRQIASIFVFAKLTVRSVMAQAYANKKRENAPDKDTLLQSLSKSYSADKLREAYDSLKHEDRSIIRFRGIEKLSYPVIQSRWLVEYEQPVTEEALRMRFSRAVKAFENFLRA
jgi:DNA-directed RNA polymerase specialized sigma24 family protein